LVEHGLVDFLAPLFALLRRELAGDIDRFTGAYRAGAEGERNLEAVPAPERIFEGEVVGDGENRQAGQLGQRDDARVYLIAWAARAIGRDCQVQSLLGAGVKLDHRLGAAPAAGAAYRHDVIELQDAREHPAITAGADQCGHLALRLALDYIREIAGERKEEPVMPDAENHMLRLRCAPKGLQMVMLRVEAEADGGGEEPRDAKDQPGQEPAVPACFLGFDDAGGCGCGLLSLHFKGVCLWESLFFQAGPNQILRACLWPKHCLGCSGRRLGLRLFEAKGRQSRDRIGERFILRR
jgi:hypothetical protein